MISIIIPIHPDETLKTIYKCLDKIQLSVSNKTNITVFLVSVKDKMLNLNKYFFKIEEVIDPNATTRAKTLNIGFQHINTEIVAFLHCDTIVPSSFDKLIIDKLKNTPFCYFKLQFDNLHLALKIICTQVNNLRNFPYGDQCFCMKSSFHRKMKLFKDLPFMEDYQYVLDLPVKYRSNAIDAYVITSARRYKNCYGFSYKSIFSNVLNNKNLIKRYHQGENINELSKIYYKNQLLGTDFMVNDALVVVDDSDLTIEDKLESELGLLSYNHFKTILIIILLLIILYNFLKK